VYDRSWTPSDAAIDPVKFGEPIVGSDKRDYVHHEAMEYNRELSQDLREYLFVTLAKSGDQASVNIYIGIPLNVNNLKVLAV